MRAEILGAKAIVFHLPHYVSLEEDEERVLDFMREYVAFAREHGVRIFLENDGHGPWSDPENIKRVINGVGGLLMNLDFGHLNITCNTDESCMRDFVGVVKDSIAYVHVHDNFGVIDDHIGLGEARIPVGFVLDTIKKTSPEFVVAESFKLQEALKTLEVLTHPQ